MRATRQTSTSPPAASAHSGICFNRGRDLGLLGLLGGGGAAVAADVEVHEEDEEGSDVRQVHAGDAGRKGLALGVEQPASLRQHADELQQLALGEVLLPPGARPSSQR